MDRYISPQKSTPTKIIESFLGSLELEGSELAIVPLEIGKERISGDRGLEAEDHEAVEVGNGDEKVPRW